MPTTFANTISLDGGTTNLPIYADRAEKDAAGNSLQTTYATKSELATGLSSKQDTISDLATIRSGAAAGATAVQSGDLATVATTGAYSDLSGTPTIPPALSAGNGIDITNNVVSADLDGTSLTNGANGLSVTLPVPDTTGASQGDVLSVGQSGLEWAAPSGSSDLFYATISPPTTFNEIQNAVNDGKYVLLSHQGSLIPLTVIKGSGSFAKAYFQTIDNPYDSSNRNNLRLTTYTCDYNSSWRWYNTFVPPGSSASDAGKVLTVNSSGNAEWATPSGGGSVTDVEVNGTSVVNASGVAEVTVPAQVNADWNSSSGASEILNKPTIPSGAQLVPAATSSDADKVLTVDAQGIPEWAESQGLFIAQYGTSTYDEVHAAARAGKIVYCYVNGRFAFLAYTNVGGNDHNYEFQYYRSAASGKDSVFIYKVRPAGSTYGPEWETTQRDVKAGNISYPVTNVKVNGSSVMSGTVAEITLPAIPVTDVEVDGTSVVNASGVAEITMPTELVPTVTSSDNNKVLKASYSGGVASYSWQTESGGGGGGGSYTAGTGIDITNDVISVDTSVVATQTDLADKEDAFNVGTGLEMDTTGGVNTLQVETPMDIVAGPGIAIDNPDSDTLRVSVGTTFTQAQLDYLKAALGLDETVLYSGLKSNPDTGAATYQLSESPLNFQLIKLYCCASDNSFNSSSAIGNQGVLIVEWDTTVYLPYNTFIPQLMNGGMGTSFTQYWAAANISGIRTTTWTVQGSLNSATSNARWFHIYKIVGVHRIANN